MAGTSPGRHNPSKQTFHEVEPGASVWHSLYVPEISRFFGIVIRMFYNDHMPAHFHAVYGDDEALIEIETLAVYRGHLPRRALALVLEWAALHREELRQDWELARSGATPNQISPLD